MNPSHYPSLELCKKLTEAGFGRTEKYWMKPKSIPHILYTYEHTSNAFQRYDYWCPSVMELLDEMPRDIHLGHHQYTWNITPYGFTYAPNQFHSTDKIPFFATDMSDDSDIISIDPNALAEMWLWLKENNYLTK